MKDATKAARKTLIEDYSKRYKELSNSDLAKKILTDNNKKFLDVKPDSVRKQISNYRRSLPKESIIKNVNIIPQKIKVHALSADWHMPYMDVKAKELYLKILKDVKPDAFHIDGDGLDSPQFSGHGKRGKQKPVETLDESHNTANYILDEFDEALGDIGKKYQLGNHEDRLQKWLMENPDFKWAKLEVQNFLKLLERKYKVYGYNEAYQIGKLFVVHGWRSGIQAVRNHLIQDFHRSFIMGHIHRTDMATSTTIDGHLIQGHSVGCLCRLDWNYTQSRNSNHGIAIIYEYPNGNFEIFHVKFINNTASFERQIWTV
jgi:hypothetical protein